MGDYNLNIPTPLVTPQTPNASIDEMLDEIVTVQEKLTTLSGTNTSNSDIPNSGKYANNYDHFTYSLKSSPFKSVSYDRVDAVEKYCSGDYSFYRDNISDHLPIKMIVDI